MIDINLVNKEFDKYVSQFNPNDGKIKLKIDHIKRVAKVSEELAQNLNLPEEQIKLAKVIGLFHDIGRFRQAEIYNTFNDRESINHAELGVKVLFEEKIIDNFNIDEKYYRIIKIAVLNHNTIEIEQGLSEEELLFAKIIRDADKLDIFYTFCNYDFESAFWYSDFSCEKINDVVMKQFMNKSIIDYTNVHTNADQIIVCFGYIYDFNFSYSLKYLRDKKYLEEFTEKVVNQFSSKELEKQVRKVLDIANEYIGGIVK